MAGQGANNGPSQAAGSQFVKFTLASAQRIAKTVRTVEAGNRSQAGVTFEHPQTLGSVKLVRRGTFSGAWPINSTAVVTFVQSPTATVNATNLTWPLGGCTQSTTTCIVGKEGTNWWLITPALPSLQGYSGSSIQLLGHSDGGCLKWFDITTCSTSAT